MRKKYSYLCLYHNRKWTWMNSRLFEKYCSTALLAVFWQVRTSNMERFRDSVSWPGMQETRINFKPFQRELFSPATTTNEKVFWGQNISLCISLSARAWSQDHPMSSCFISETQQIQHYRLRGSMGFEKYKKWTKVDTCFSFNKPTKQDILHFLT